MFEKKSLVLSRWSRAIDCFDYPHLGSPLRPIAPLAIPVLRSRLLVAAYAVVSDRPQCGEPIGRKKQYRTERGDARIAAIRTQERCRGEAGTAGGHAVMY